MGFSNLLWIGAILLLTVICIEMKSSLSQTEGFSGIIPYDTSYFGQFAPKRGDIGPVQEEGGYTRDARYFQGYTDVQRLGVNNDFCRMVQSKTNPEIFFFACALAGTENMASTDFRTPTTKEGLKLSRDDYIHDIDKDGRADYCRILKAADGTYKPVCNRARDHDFDTRTVLDTSPPDEIQTLLTFYDGCVFWWRFRDDMLDYVSNTQVTIAGSIKIDETPRPEVTKGVKFNGIDQFLRIGEKPDLELGNVVKLRSLRAICFWVYFDEFTNNAHILDFGNGGGDDNVWVGIIGRGDALPSSDPIRGDEDQSTVPSGSSGAQKVPEVTPRQLMETTAANVDVYQSIGFETQPRRLPASRAVPRNVSTGPATKATLMYEVWDQKQRKLRMMVPAAIPKQKWTHVAITADGMDSFRPTIKIFINGEAVITKPSGYLPQAGLTTNNYLGKSNWLATTSQYENKDELFKGSLFDVRGYATPMSYKKIRDTVTWGKKLLGIE